MRCEPIPLKSPGGITCIASSMLQKRMGRLDFWETIENCLCHLDLYARKIMVDPQPDDTIRITGILD